jgi:hypothetical protein
MRPRAIVGIAAALLLGLSLGSARAAIIGIYTFDENTNASWTGKNQPPKGTAIKGGGITYDITVTGEKFKNADVGTYAAFYEPGHKDDANYLSEVFKIATQTTFEFYSNSPEPDSPAKDTADSDVALKDRFKDVKFVFSDVEQGLRGKPYTDGQNAILFAKTMVSGNEVAFVGISDVPEPSTLVVAVVGTFALFGFSLRHCKRAAA